MKNSTVQWLVYIFKKHGKYTLVFTENDGVKSMLFDIKVAFLNDNSYNMHVLLKQALKFGS